MITITVSGPKGVGKTEICQLFAKILKDKGCQVKNIPELSYETSYSGVKPTLQLEVKLNEIAAKQLIRFSKEDVSLDDVVPDCE